MYIQINMCMWVGMYTGMHINASTNIHKLPTYIHSYIHINARLQII